MRELNLESLAGTFANNDLVLVNPPEVREEELVSPENILRPVKFRAELSLPSHLAVGTSFAIAPADYGRFGRGQLVLLERGGGQHCASSGAGVRWDASLMLAHLEDRPEQLKLLRPKPVSVQSRERRSCGCRQAPACVDAPEQPLFLRVPAGHSLSSADDLPYRVVALTTDFPLDDFPHCMCERDASLLCVEIEERTAL